ncbi:hypothetical protein CK203_023296 [Vitis vinifera]|uniref:Retrovirus-related Pol polyprotein from transposon TNT 1-94-like beta-barrel domain-containing protein n=1 Tax=Vitis vinifera TaxID=29760 RepID=A0A438J1U9_VITVI|nr:hypothetical protein CK203_023296 [Vitis vinifera]
MDSKCISNRNEFTGLPKNNVRPKSWSPIHITGRVSSIFKQDITSEFLRKVTKKHSHGAYRVSPLPEEENVDLNSNDSSYTMRGSTSLPSANAVGKCSNLGLTSGFFKDITSEFLRKVTKKHSHGAYRVSPSPEEENVDLNSNDSSSTMRVSTSLPTANIAGKCSNLCLKLRILEKEAGEKTPHVANKLFLIPVEEEKLHSYEPSEIKVLFSPQLAGPSMFDFSGLLSGSTIPSSSNSSSLWILDSGATHHVCYSRASFEPFTPTFNSFVALPNGHTVPVGGTGSVRLCNDLTLQNVLFVPQFHCNLLSISALTQQHPYVVSFHSDHYVIEDPTQGRKIGIGRQANNLYTLDLSQMFFVSP